MNRWRWGGRIIIGGLLAGPLVVSGLRRSPTEGQALKRHGAATQVMKAYQADAAAMWSPQWVADGVPVRLRQQRLAPSIVADPANPRLTWWFWPQVQDGQVWFGVGRGRGVAWHGVSVRDMAQMSTLPQPVRATAQWVTTLESGRGPMPGMRTEPAGAFMADMGSVTGVTGWEAAMESQPRTIVVTWGLTRPHGTGLRFITLWHWLPRLGWQCTLGVLQNEPTVQLANGGMPHGVPSRLPGWAISPKR
ncbi:hypothetical protein [Sulfobacillus harzensis]|uniref:Uncharacterized protein n=1 Tax=Sulfobacillus harzensis TaxID=2729629 RepID=A0A7Y0Q3K2_9FIRM|nr:hypothetical protein [Sulfobacillus harzensis]NMP23480.1 hypothetical protein [Sulfobacillus harzensis]